MNALVSKQVLPYYAKKLAAIIPKKAMLPVPATSCSSPEDLPSQERGCDMERRPCNTSTTFKEEQFCCYDAAKKRLCEKVDVFPVAALLQVILLAYQTAIQQCVENDELRLVLTIFVIVVKTVLLHFASNHSKAALVTADTLIDKAALVTATRTAFLLQSAIITAKSFCEASSAVGIALAAADMVDVKAKELAANENALKVLYASVTGVLNQQNDMPLGRIINFANTAQVGAVAKQCAFPLAEALTTAYDIARKSLAKEFRLWQGDDPLQPASIEITSKLAFALPEHTPHKATLLATTVSGMAGPLSHSEGRAGDMNQVRASQHPTVYVPSDG